MKRSPEYESGVNLYDGGVRIRERAGDIFGFIEFDFRALNGVFLVGVMEGEPQERLHTLLLGGRGGVLKRLGDVSYFAILT